MCRMLSGVTLSDAAPTVRRSVWEGMADAQLLKVLCEAPEMAFQSTIFRLS
jgi:hypothetical protein